MTKYGQYCPVARSVEILGDRWTLLIVRDLLDGRDHFNDLERGLPGIPRAVLADRLRRLQSAGLLERQVESSRRRTRYQLTQAGKELSPVIDALTRWGARWAFGEPDTSELDPILLLWWMRDRVYLDRLPRRRVVVEFAFQGPRRYTYWLILQPTDVSICLTHPGFEVDVHVTAELATLYKVWLGRMTFMEALREQLVDLDAPPSLARSFTRWFAWSPAAEVVRAEKNHTKH
ncbi:MAG TPA: helix-turn-helix domain-containing protein [Anaerolineales bacterium]|jgi:DNA-binding HxlR family transcriptional regulator|nr:helix-turn-helix domain-containing protein [Anaerolineales bacterium]